MTQSEKVKQILKTIDELSSLVAELQFDEFDSEGIDIEEISEKIAQEISNEGSDLIDDYEFSLSGNEINVDQVYFDTRALSRTIEAVLTDCLKPKKEKK